MQIKVLLYIRPRPYWFALSKGESHIFGGRRGERKRLLLLFPSRLFFFWSFSEETFFDFSSSSFSSSSSSTSSMMFSLPLSLSAGLVRSVCVCLCYGRGHLPYSCNLPSALPSSERGWSQGRSALPYPALSLPSFLIRLRGEGRTKKSEWVSQSCFIGGRCGVRKEEEEEAPNLIKERGKRRRARDGGGGGKKGAEFYAKHVPMY